MILQANGSVFCYLYELSRLLLATNVLRYRYLSMQVCGAAINSSSMHDHRKLFWSCACLQVVGKLEGAGLRLEQLHDMSTADVDAALGHAASASRIHTYRAPPLASQFCASPRRRARRS
jgi:hypothetical protein